MGKKCPLVRTAKALYDITGQRSSLLPILIPFPSLASHCVFFSPSDTFSEPPSVVSSCAVSASLSQLLSAARHTDRQTDRLTELLWCLLVNTRWVPDGRHQDACCILCFIILLFWSQRLPVKRGEPGSAGAGGDQRVVSPTAPLDTDFRLHTSP